MRINKIYINAFGKLRDYTLELESGFNVICGENENGKTTVMNFIKMMFYGSGKRTQSIATNYRLKYTPWSGDTMGGRIYFEHASHRYCLEREFRKSDSTDRIVLTNLDSGETESVASDVGSSFFGLSMGAFERCVFIEESTFSKDPDADGELNSRLSGLVLTGSDSISYQTVISRIENARNKIISKSGRTGSFAKDSELLEEAKERLLKAKNDAARKSELGIALSKLKDRYDNVISELEVAQRTVNSATDIKNREKLNEFLRIKEKVEQSKKELTLSDGTLADNMFIGKIDFCLNRLDTHNKRIEELEEETRRIQTDLSLSSEEKIEQTKERLAEATERRSAAEAESSRIKDAEHINNNAISQTEQSLNSAKDKRKPVNLTLLLIGIAATVLPIVLFMIISKPLILPFAAVGIIFIILSLIIRPIDKSFANTLEVTLEEQKNKKYKYRSQLEALAQQISSLDEQIAVLSSAVEVNAELRAQRRADLDHRLEAIKSESEKRNAVYTDISSLISRFPGNISLEDIADVLKGLSTKAEELKTLKLKLNYLCNDLGGISYEEAHQKLAACENTDSGADLEAARTALDKLNSEKSELISTLSAVATELKTGFNNSEEPEAVKKEISELSASLKAKKDFCDAADIACEALRESFNEIRSSYGSVLEEKTLKYFSHLTNGAYSDVKISKSLDINVEQKNVFGTREAAYLSRGTADQVYLSLRLALSGLISENEAMPLFLDDVLAQYDDERAENALAFLKEYSADSQIILFTCHKALKQKASELGAICRDFK